MIGQHSQGVLSEKSSVATLPLPAGTMVGPPSREWFQVGSTQTVFSGELDEARRDFSTYKAISIRNFLEPSLLSTVLRLCESGSFGPGQAAPGFREVETPQRAGRVLNLAINRPTALRWLEEVTGCMGLRSIEGRVTQTLHRPGDELLWHDDIPAEQRRRLAVVVNLSTSSYEGGDFEMRFKRGATLVRHRYTEVGAALIFKVDPALEHRVYPLSGGGPRRVFAGWAFGSELP